MKRFIIFILVVAGIVLSQPALAASDGLDGALQCYCDCGKFLVTCDCGSAAEAGEYIDSLRAAGKDDSEIAQLYGERYGEEYVNYIPKSGRGLSLWLLPPLGVIIGAGALYYRLRRTGEVSSRANGARCSGCGASLAQDAKFCIECGEPAGVTTCTGCGSQVSDDDAFCTGCGEPVVADCPSCGTATDPGASFCSGCGEPL